MHFDNEHCFLCGNRLNSENSTVEHVFPKWLQNKHELWNQTLGLPNTSKIKYRQLVIPCCKNCNNSHLSPIENAIKEAFEVGHSEVKNLEITLLYKWLMKIFYGIMFKDLSLLFDRGNKEKGNILSTDFVLQYKFMFDCMQSIIMPIKLDENYSSLFIFKIHNDVRNDSRLNFFYADDLLNSQITIQSGNTGVICCIGDNKAIERKLSTHFKPFYEITLQPVQYRQVIAEVFYMRSLLMNKISSIITPDEILLIPSFFDNYNEYVYVKYAAVLYYFLKYFDFKPEDIYDEKLDAVLNLMLDDSKRIIIYDEHNNVSFGKVHVDYSGELFPTKNIEAKAFPE